MGEGGTQGGRGAGKPAQVWERRGAAVHSHSTHRQIRGALRSVAALHTVLQCAPEAVNTDSVLAMGASLVDQKGCVPARPPSYASPQNCGGGEGAGCRALGGGRPAGRGRCEQRAPQRLHAGAGPTHQPGLAGPCPSRPSLTWHDSTLSRGAS